MKGPKYTYRISWSEEDQAHVATCVELPSLSHLAKGEEGAVRGIKVLVRGVIEDMKKEGQVPPVKLAKPQR